VAAVAIWYDHRDTSELDPIGNSGGLLPATADVTEVNPAPPAPADADPDPRHGPGSRRDLLVALRAVVDPRDRRGIRHPLVSILALAAAAVVAGDRSYVALGQWAAHAPAEVLGALEVRVHPREGRFVVPHESTIRRTLHACDGDQVDAVLGAWLYPRLDPEQVITVDGKTPRGARAGHGRAVHLLAAMLAGPAPWSRNARSPTRTNEITAFAPLLDGLDLSGGVGQR